MNYDILHHYTSASTMELILKHRTIRFNNLKNVNDKEEIKTTGLHNFGRYCLVSCWTYIHDESPLHWTRYTPKGKGVRISFPVNPFDYGFDVYEYLLHNKMIENRVAYTKGKLPYPELVKVGYTHDEALIIPNTLLEGSYGEAVLNSRILGMYKRAQWSGEKEVRYRLLLEPGFSSIGPAGEAVPSYDVDTCEINWRAYGDLCPFKAIDHLDFKLRDECVDNVKVMIGPNNSFDERNQIMDIIHAHCRNPEITASGLGFGI